MADGRLEKHADAGDAGAADKLGDLLAGRGLKGSAETWYRKAAGRG
jgi:hypothetical protein